MAVTLRAAGTWENGTTGLTADEVVAVPAAQVIGDMMLLIGCWKDYAITAVVSGWTELGEVTAGGTTGTGNGTGTMKVGIWYKVATGDPEADPTLDFSTTTGLLGEAVIVVFQKAAGESWATPVAVEGLINTWGTGGGSTSASATVTVPSGGCVVGVAAIRDNTATFTRASTAIDDAAAAVTWNGNYVESPATHADTTTGNDMACDAGYRLVTTGAAGVTLRQSGTLSATETGTAVWIVLNDETPATTVNAEVATATGAAYQPSISITVNAGYAAATFAAYDVTAEEPVVVPGPVGNSGNRGTRRRRRRTWDDRRWRDDMDIEEALTALLL